MKMKIICIIALCLSVALLCSFSKNNAKYENISLQNEENKSKSSEKTDYSGTLSEKSEDELQEIYDMLLDAIPDGAPKNTDEAMGALGIERTLGWISGFFTSGESVSTVFVFVAVGMLFSLSELLSHGSGIEGSAAGVILTVPILHRLIDALIGVSEGIRGMSETFSALIPALTALLAIGGGGSAASVSGAGMSISLGIVSGALSGCLLPLSAMIFSSSIASSFDTVGVTEGVVKGIRGLFGFLVGFSSLIIIGMFGAQTVLAVSADNLALKSAKYAVSGMIPVVGGAVSGALSALISGVKLLSATVGTVSVVALLFTVTAPLAKLLLLRFCLWLSITVASFSGGSQGARLLGSLRSALDTLIAILVSSTLVYLLEIIIVTGSIRGAL